MDPPTNMYMTSYLTVWLVPLLVAILFTVHLLRRKPNLPPGPKPWPIIGNLNLIGPLPHRSLHELSKTYGHVMMLRFGAIPVLVGSSKEIAKLILKTHDEIFAGRPKNSAAKYTTYDYSNMTWSQYGPYFKQARKICLTELFSFKRLESFEYIRIEERNSMLKGIFNTNGEPFLLKDRLSTLSLNVICRMVLGKSFLDLNNDRSSIVTRDEFKNMLDELFLLNGVINNIGDWIPCIKFLDVQGYVKRMKIVGKKFNMFMEHVLDQHNARRENDKENWEPKDMVDVLLQLADDPTLEVKLERAGVKAFSQDMIAGGTESSSMTVEWAITELLRNPDVITKATEELDQVIGKERWVKESDMPNLPYIRAIAKETMRLHSVTPLLVPRMSSEAVKIDGYDIPKGSLALVNTFTIHRDPQNYENPNEFRPERFIDKNVDLRSQHFEFLPFGSGRRMCPGYTLGLKTVESSLANLLHGFSWKLGDNMKPENLDMEETFGLTSPKKVPICTRARPRLPHHMYDM